MNATVPTPFAHGEFGLAKQGCDLSRGVELLRSPQAD
jgi:hypothetical protein